MNKNILVIVEEKDGLPKKVSFELLSKAYELKEKTGGQSYAVFIGNDHKILQSDIRQYADSLIQVQADFEELQYGAYVTALKSIIEQYSPLIVTGSSSSFGRAVLSCTSAITGLPFISEATDIKIEDGILMVKKPLFGGRISGWFGIESSSILVSFRPKSFSIKNLNLEAELKREEFSLKKDNRIRIISVEEKEKKKISLEEADFIICGGKGMKAQENFQVLAEIADIMDGSVAASRAVVDAGWRPYEEQIGKSGKTVSPKIYVGCGVSGAVHHIMGMDTSKVIVAINNDERAPIFNYADYGIIHDLFEVLPHLKEELKKLKF